MVKRLMIFAVAVLALAIAMPAFAAVQNVKVSGDLTVQAVGRDNFGFVSDQGPTVNTVYNYTDDLSGFLSTARLRVDAELTDNVAVVVRLLNERVWDQEAAATTDIDLDLAYVTLKEFLYSPLNLTLGRQELHFGNDLIIGDPDTNNTATGSGLVAAGLANYGDLSSRKAFDAIRANLNYTVVDKPLAVDVVYSKINENTFNQVDDVVLYGVNTNYPVSDNLSTELYFWTREIQPNIGTGAFTNLENKIKTERLHTVGTRVAYTGIENLNLQAEYAAQMGNKLIDQTTMPNEYVATATSARNGAGNRIDHSFVKANAWALQLMGSYALPEVRHTPVLGVSYTHLSGEKADSTQAWNAWDSMYENQLSGTIFNTILGQTNCDLINLNGSLKPDFVDDLTLAVNWYHILLDEALATGNRSGYTLTNGQLYNVTNDKHFGDEVDLGLTYDYTEDVQLGLNVGWLMPGDTLQSNNDETASQAIASMKVTF